MRDARIKGISGELADAEQTIETIHSGTITDESDLMCQPKPSQKPKALCRLRDFADKVPMRFILMTNATRVRLTGFHGHVEEAKLDHDMQPDESKMKEPYWKAWSEFLAREVREDVRIQFVFTRSA
jgi:hypothetical protein